MRLTVLGCYGPYPAAGQCCSGYLLEDEQVSVLLDCGNGVLSRMRYHIEPWALDAVVLSHLHSDHVSDVMILRYALMINAKQRPREALSVYAPAYPEEEFSRLSYKEFLKAEPVSAETILHLGSMRFCFFQAVHAVPSHVITVESAGKKLTFSGDTEFFAGLGTIAKNSDLFLCEANYLQKDIENGSPNHLSAFQAAQAAKEGAVKRLVLTHHHPERDQQLTLQEAKEVFPHTELAYSGSFYRL